MILGWDIDQWVAFAVVALLLGLAHHRWPLPWKETFRLLTDAIRSLQRNKWIVAVFLIGDAANSIVWHAIVIGAEGRYRQLHPEVGALTTHLDEFGLSRFIQWGWMMGCGKLAGMLFFSPLGLFSAWLAFFFLLGFWGPVRRVLFGSQPMRSMAQRMI